VCWFPTDLSRIFLGDFLKERDIMFDRDKIENQLDLICGRNVKVDDCFYDEHIEGLKCYVIIVSQYFPSKHIKKSDRTGFIFKICIGEKVHTIRGNYDLWKKRFDNIEKGKAYLSVRIWKGQPYKSKQEEVFRFFKNDGIGIEKLQFSTDNRFGEYASVIRMDNDIEGFESYMCQYYEPFIEQLAANDGLNKEDFLAWFNPLPKEDCVIIHFNSFRYVV
jgi:hypothetical protein